MSGRLFSSVCAALALGHCVLAYLSSFFHYFTWMLCCQERGLGIVELTKYCFNMEWKNLLLNVKQKQTFVRCIQILYCNIEYLFAQIRSIMHTLFLSLLSHYLILYKLTGPHMERLPPDPRFNLTGREYVRTNSHIQNLITAKEERRSLVSVWPGARAGPAQETVF